MRRGPSLCTSKTDLTLSRNSPPLNTYHVKAWLYLQVSHVALLFIFFWETQFRQNDWALSSVPAKSALAGTSMSIKNIPPNPNLRSRNDSSENSFHFIPLYKSSQSPTYLKLDEDILRTWLGSCDQSENGTVPGTGYYMDFSHKCCSYQDP